MRISAAITNGEFLDTLYSLVSEEFIQENMMLLSSPARRKSLPYDLAVKTFQEIGLTVYEVFQKTSLPYVELSSEDQRFLHCLEKLPADSLFEILNQIDNLQYPWWLDQDAREANTFWKKIHLLLVRKYPNLYWYRPEFQLPNTLSILKNFSPKNPKLSVSTDLIPAICSELDVSYNWLMPFGDDIYYYSKAENVDLVFMRYKLLYKELRCIPLTYAEMLSNKES